MDLGSFRDELRSRDGEAPVWLVYLDDAIAQLRDEPESLVLQRTFWSRGEAYAYAQRRHRERRWQHFHVFRAVASISAVDLANWEATFEMSFERAGAPRTVRVSPTGVAHAFGNT